MSKTSDEKVILDLRKSLAWLDLVMATLDEGVLTVSEDLRVMYANDAVAQLVDRSRILLLGLPIWEALPLFEDGVALTREHYEQAIEMRKTKRSLRHTHELRTAAATFLVDVSIGFIPKENQTVFIVHDVTERQKAEQERLKLLEERASRLAIEKSKADLKESEEKFRTLIELSADAIQLISPDGRIFFTSDSVQQVLGYKPEEIASHTAAEYVHPDDFPYFMNKIAELLEKPQAKISAQYRVKHKDGTWAWVEATGVNHLETPNISAIVGNFRNITKRKNLEQQKDEFLGIASHELKTPVTSIKAYTQVLHRTFIQAGDSRSAELVSKMDTQLNKLNRLIEDLLDVTKIEGGKLLLSPSWFDFNKLVLEVVEEMQRTTIHTIVLDLALPRPVYGDRDRIGQVVINLLSNAIKYSPPESDIKLMTIITENSVTLTVHDGGPGISKADTELIFERFYRIGGDKRETYPGLGLGLYISAEIIQRHGGRIWVESEKGQGSTFYFIIPFPAQTVVKN